MAVVTMKGLKWDVLEKKATLGILEQSLQLGCSYSLGLRFHGSAGGNSNRQG